MTDIDNKNNINISSYKNYTGYDHNHTLKVDEIISHIEPKTPCGEFFRRYWHPVALSSEVKQEPLPV